MSSFTFSPADNLPVDIWIYISQFIPDDTLKDLYPINRMFFDLAMDIRYRNIDVCASPSLEMLSRVLRLQDPLVANRVRTLKITNVVTESYSHERHKTLLARIASSISSLSTTVCETVFRPNVVQVQAAVQLVLSALPQVKHLVIEVWDTNYLWGSAGVSKEQSHNYVLDILRIARDIWATVGSTIESLILTGMHDNLVSLLDPLIRGPSPPPKLADLSIELLHSLHLDISGTVSTIAPFVKSVQPTLRGLRIDSFPALDLSQFFSALATSPELERFTIRAPFNVAFQSDSSGLTRFIVAHCRTLREMRLLLNPTRSALNAETVQSLSDWLSGSVVTPDLNFPQVELLDIHPTNLPAGIEALIGIVRRSRTGLRSLAIRDTYLKLADIKALVSALPNGGMGLRKLRMNVMVLSVGLLDLLVEKTPMLEEMSLFIASMGGAQEEDVSESSMEIFHSELETRRYTGWGLRKLRVLHRGMDLDTTTAGLLRERIGAEYVPA